jgi:ABC-type glutathione transport system ATPase component
MSDYLRKEEKQLTDKDKTLDQSRAMADQGIDHTVLSVKGLRKYFPVRRGFFQKVIGWIKAVDGVDLEIGQAKTLGLVGESGCGKTTVGHLILKLLESDGGKIVFRGRDITAYAPEQMKPLRKDMQIISSPSRKGCELLMTEAGLGDRRGSGSFWKWLECRQMWMTDTPTSLAEGNGNESELPGP